MSLNVSGYMCASGNNSCHRRCFSGHVSVPHIGIKPDIIDAMVHTSPPNANTAQLYAERLLLIIDLILSIDTLSLNRLRSLLILSYFNISPADI